LDDLWGGRFLPVSCPAAPVIRHPPQRGPSLPPQRPLGRTPNGRRPSRAQAVSPVFLHSVPCRPPLRCASFRSTFAPLQEVGDPPRLALATPALAAGWLRGCWLTTTANTKKPKGQPDEHTSQVSILDNAPATFNAPQLRVLLRALIHIDPYDFIDEVAAHFVGDDENSQQGAEEILLSVIDGLDDENLPGFALRLALTGHVEVPRDGEIDHLTEAERLLIPVQPKAAPKKSSAKAVRKPASAKAKSAKKQTGKKVAA
jgi:hypothetical protein